jgi:hypothetical protein
MTKKEINIARLIYDAYPHADLLPIDPEEACRDLPALLAKVTSENIGDGLFTFLVIEIVEGGEGTLDGAIRVTKQAGEDVKAVLQALLGNSGVELLEACKTITSYTTDLLYRLDNQINLNEIEEIQQAKDAIARYTSFVTNQS